MVRKKDKDETAAQVPDGVNCDETVCTLPADIQNDEFRGMGGSYIVDPATGKRVRVAGPNVVADEQESGAIVTTETEKADEIE